MEADQMYTYGVKLIINLIVNNNNETLKVPNLALKVFINQLIHYHNLY